MPPGVSCGTRERSGQVNKPCWSAHRDQQPRADHISLHSYTCIFLLSLVFLGQLRSTHLLPTENSNQRLINLSSAALIPSVFGKKPLGAHVQLSLDTAVERVWLVGIIK